MARSSYGQACANDATEWQQKWQRVASTHTLVDLLTVDQPADFSAPICWKTVAFGAALCMLGGTFLFGIPMWLLSSVVFGHTHVPEWAILFVKDQYFGPLLTMTVPVACAAICLHWLASKLFKHNYWEALFQLPRQDLVHIPAQRSSACLVLCVNGGTVHFFERATQSCRLGLGAKAEEKLRSFTAQVLLTGIDKCRTAMGGLMPSWDIFYGLTTTKRTRAWV